MRSGDALRRDVLRMAANAAYNVEKRNQKPLTEDEFLAVLTREVKTRRESVDAYGNAGRNDGPGRGRRGSRARSESDLPRVDRGGGLVALVPGQPVRGILSISPNI